ncbi:hypothetical protein [Enterococcus avium]|uniref:hypothetical protein n=1 Tax=Enterococcus avium TaxID=33945 RepID=UPI000C9CFE25|nr:hypothetical protein [Enterococcus avium]PNE45696.1 hypothetical protein AUF14_04695 [Enterococcus avium]DAL80751.1 MAG TPA: hypothetical protein [Caudoviricetes sp.]
MSSSDEILTVESFLFICKKIDLSIEEMDMLDIGGCLDLMQEWVDQMKDQNKDEDKVNIRRATQADFDSF